MLGGNYSEIKRNFRGLNQLENAGGNLANCLEGWISGIASRFGSVLLLFDPEIHCKRDLATCSSLPVCKKSHYWIEHHFGRGKHISQRIYDFA